LPDDSNNRIKNLQGFLKTTLGCKQIFTKKNCVMKKTLLISSFLLLLLSCQKNIDKPAIPEEMPTTANQNSEYGQLQQTKTYSSDVITRWLNQQLDMLRVPLAAGTGSQAADRAMAYCGIAAYESVVPGMPAYQSLTNQLNGFPGMPSTEPGKAYHWAASANAALAEMNRRLFPNTSATNKTNIDNLENELKAVYANEVDASTLDRSIAFGKEVATRVFAWAATDGSANVNPQYVPEPQFIGPGFWVQSLGAGNTLVTTPPNSPQAANPYAYQRRRMVPGVENGAVIEPPPAYSTDPSSAFYLMVKDVYDKSNTLTPEQTAMAIYHRDAPGYPGGGQFVAILSQVIDKADVMLDVAALAYAKTGIAMFDATTILFKEKYSINLVRPINYIRSVMGYSTWLGLFNTPGHPEFPSGHAMISATVAGSLTNVFGENFEFDNHTYDYLGLPPRHYNSFAAMAQEMSDSRVFAGIHYQATCDESLWLGGKVTQNVLSTVKFLKE
jgi:hypothetical protein